MSDIVEHDPRPRKMLIADDDPAILRLLADRCQRMGFQVETAMNGVQLLVKVRHNHPDIVVVDVDMPALDGLSVCARLLDPGRKALEVVVITGGGEAETVERCDSLGTFFARKGPHFWKGIMQALTEIYPDLLERTAALSPPQAAVPQRPRVLVVDDDPDYEKFLASRLAKYGIDTLYAADAIHACRIAGKDKPSVIVADNFMPDGDAQFLLYRLRATPATAAIPVVVVSASPLGELDTHNLEREISGRPGAIRVLRKSFDTCDLFETLRSYCAFKTPRAAPRSCLETEGW